MMWEEPGYILLVSITASTMVITALYIWLTSRVPGAKMVSLLIISGTIWVLSYITEISTTSTPVKAFLDKIQFSTMVILPTLWIIYVLQFGGLEKWLTSRTIISLSIPPGSAVLLVFTNDIHTLLWSNVQVVSKASLSVLERTYHAGYWVFVAYSYFLVFLGIYLIIQVFIQSRHVYPHQGRALLFTVILPLLGWVLYIFGAIPIARLDWSPLLVVATAIATAWGLARMQLGDITPIAWEAVISSMGDSVVVLDNSACVVKMNPAALNLFNVPASEVVGKPVDKIWPGRERDILKGGTREVVMDGKQQRTYDMRVSPLTDWRGHTVNLVVVLRDITERKLIEEQIKASLEEKEILLREIHHRVKNNLQVISSLLNLQSATVKDGYLKEMLKESQNRIKSIALIHEKLYKSETLANVNSKEYVTSLLGELIRSYGAVMGRVSLNIEVENVPLKTDTAIPCGLIITELFSNCLKHAFPGDRRGEIWVTLRSMNDEIELGVSDNGVGFPDMDFRNTPTLGLRLVTLLVENQLGGTITVTRTGGTLFRITFRQKS